MNRLIVQLRAGESELPAETYLIKRYGMSKSQWKRIKHLGDFRWNGLAVNAKHTIVMNGDVLTFESERPKDPNAFPLTPEHIPLDIRYEDRWLLAINKPTNMVVHPLYNTPHGTLANAVLGYYEEKGLTHAFHPLHRLDRNTTGLVLVAKEPELQHMLTKNGVTKLFHRHYLAIACGRLPAKEGWLDDPMGPAPDSYVKQMVKPESEGGKAARTHYEVLGETTAGGQPLSLVRLWLETGRTHQIRVHLAHIGCPLLGDDLYGAPSDLIGRQALHAAELSFRHPITKEDVKITAPPPEDFQKLLDAFFQKF